MRVLFLSRWYPYPPDNGSKIRVFSLLGGLCEKHDVTLLSFYDPAETPAEPPASTSVPRQIHRCPYREFDPGSGKALAGFLKSTPRYLVDTHNPEMEQVIRQTLRQDRYDLVIASQLSMAAYWQSFHGLPAIFEEVELGSYRPQGTEGRSPWSQVRTKLTWAKHTRFMAGLLRNFILCTVASDVERQLLAAAVPDYAPVHVVPNTITAEPIGQGAPARAPGSLIFTGSLRYAPNRDSMTWFISEILPLVRAQVPDVRLAITGDAGAHPPPTDPNVVMTGHVPDVRLLVAGSAVSVVPIRAGGGTRLKILEAMALRTPVVTTTKAVEGLEARDGEHLVVADTPRDFADAVLRLLRDPENAEAMADRAWRFYQTRYDSSVVIPRFLELVDHAVAA